ncbi:MULTISPECIES: type IV conjugative transfer system protein TraL [Salinisphaera]|uniref:type IV conjugative transfer system protein TraL n=1 Tax=Salinisphaera TaxID=180541 RepID=UPI0033426ADE
MEYEIPQGIDDPPQVLLWNLNELAPIVLGLVIGMITGNAMLLTAGGLIITHIYRRAGARSPDGHIIHFMYWQGVPLRKTVTLPNTFVRIFVP